MDYRAPLAGLEAANRAATLYRMYRALAATVGPRTVYDGQMGPLRLGWRKAALQAARVADTNVTLAVDECEPGGYAVCRECFAKYRPRIVARLKRQGKIIVLYFTDRSQYGKIGS